MSALDAVGARSGQKWLAVYMKSMDFMQTNKKDSLKYRRDYYAEQGIDLTDKSLMGELTTRPLRTVPEGIKWMPGEEDDNAAVLGDITHFFVDAGTFKSVPAPKSYINASSREDVESEYSDFVGGARKGRQRPSGESL